MSFPLFSPFSGNSANSYTKVDAVATAESHVLGVENGGIRGTADVDVVGIQKGGIEATALLDTKADVRTNLNVAPDGFVGFQKQAVHCVGVQQRGVVMSFLPDSITGRLDHVACVVMTGLCVLQLLERYPGMLLILLGCIALVLLGQRLFRWKNVTKKPAGVPETVSLWVQIGPAPKRRLQLELSRNSTVEQLLARIQDHEGISPEQITLIHQGRTLPVDRCLSDRRCGRDWVQEIQIISTQRTLLRTVNQSQINAPILVPQEGFSLSVKIASIPDVVIDPERKLLSLMGPDCEIECEQNYMPQTQTVAICCVPSSSLIKLARYKLCANAGILPSVNGEAVFLVVT